MLIHLNHIVLEEPPHPRGLLSAIAKHQPHAVIVGELSSAFSDEVISAISHQVPSLPFVWIPDKECENTLQDNIISAIHGINSVLKVRKCRRYASGRRLIISDDRYKSLAQSEKLGVTALSRSTIQRETDIFMGQVCTACDNHLAARQYLAQVLRIDQPFRVEASYRAVHTSYKIYWLREHAMRYVSVLCHYFDGIEIQYLPQPCPPSETIDYLHYEPPTPSLYAASALVTHGFREGLVPGFRSILGMKFTGQTEEELVRDAVVLFGWCSLLREVARAQVKLMGEVLDPQSQWHKGRELSRDVHRAEGIFGDFYFLPHLREDPAQMQQLALFAVVDGVRQNSTERSIAPYRYFLEALETKQ